MIYILCYLVRIGDKRVGIEDMLIRFLYFFSLITEECLLSLLAILWNTVFGWVYLFFSPLLFTSLLSSAIHKVSSDNHFAILLLFFFGMDLYIASCAVLWTSTHSSSGTLSARTSPLNLFITSTVYSNRL